MGRSPHRTIDKLSEIVTDQECERVAAHAHMPLSLIKSVLQQRSALTPALADRLRKSLHRDDRGRVKTRVEKPITKMSEQTQRYGLPPEGYEGPYSIPVTLVRENMLLMVSDRLVSGWLRVTGKPEKVNNGTNDLIIPTEHATVTSAKNLSVRVAVQADGDSQHAD